jgi:L-iditol 2-dehydrogenase
VRAAVFRDARLGVEEWPRPGLGPGDVLLRVRGCGLCGSDIAKLVAAPAARPLVLGHEVVGDVVDVGAGVTGFAAGDRAVAAHHVPCGICHYCRRGSASMCRAFKASHLDPGGFAEYVRVPADNVRYATFRLPPSLDDETASFVEPLACCHRAVRRTGAEAGDTCVVVGLGSIGCLFVQLLTRAGAAVVGVDRLPERAELAKRFGGAAGAAPQAAPAVVHELSDGRGADHVVITGGGIAVLGWAADIVRDGGSIHYFAGGGGETLPLPLQTLYHRELTITSTYSSSPADLAAAFELIVTGQVSVNGLISHRVPLERIGEGVDLMRRHQAVKVFVTP